MIQIKNGLHQIKITREDIFFFLYIQEFNYCYFAKNLWGGVKCCGIRSCG